MWLVVAEGGKIVEVLRCLARRGLTVVTDDDLEGVGGRIIAKVEAVFGGAVVLGSVFAQFDAVTDAIEGLIALGIGVWRDEALGEIGGEGEGDSEIDRTKGELIGLRLEGRQGLRDAEGDGAFLREGMDDEAVAIVVDGARGEFGGDLGEGKFSAVKPGGELGDLTHFIHSL